MSKRFFDSGNLVADDSMLVATYLDPRYTFSGIYARLRWELIALSVEKMALEDMEEMSEVTAKEEDVCVVEQQPATGMQKEFSIL